MSTTNEVVEPAVEEKPRIQRSTIIKWIVCFALPIIILLIPTSESLTMNMKTFLAVSVFAIAMIATEVIPLFAISVALPAAYVVVVGVSPKVVFAAWSIEIPWLILGGFVLTIALQKTGLLKRIAFRLILLFGGKFIGILFGMMALGIVMSLIIADVAGKAILMGTLALGICNAMGLKLPSREAGALGMVALASALGPSYLFYTGSTGNLVPFGLMAAAGYPPPGWGEYLTHMFVPQFIYVVLSILIIAIFFKPKQPIQSKEYFKEELASYGKMKRGEWKIAILSLVLIVLIATSGVHGISIGWLFVFAAVSLMLPGMKLVLPPDIKEVNFTFILFVVACLTIGVVSVELGVGQYLADLFYPVIAGSPVRTLAGVWGLGFLINFALTPLAAYSAFAVPLLDLANGLGMDPTVVMYAFIQSLEQVIFPYEYAPVLIVFGMGMASGKDFMKFNALRALLAFICLFVLFIPWWTLVGLI